jgi:hypothetical protein
MAKMDKEKTKRGVPGKDPKNAANAAPQPKGPAEAGSPEEKPEPATEDVDVRNIPDSNGKFSA